MLFLFLQTQEKLQSGILDLVHAVQDLLSMLPQPVIALLLLFPITDESEAASRAGKSSPCRSSTKQALHAPLATIYLSESHAELQPPYFACRQGFFAAISQCMPLITILFAGNFFALQRLTGLGRRATFL